MDNESFELILFDKYLIRTDKYQFIVSIVREEKEPLILKKHIEIKGEQREVKDYSNFHQETYHPSFHLCLLKLKNEEILNSNIQTLDELIKLLNKIDEKIERIRKRFY